MFYIFGISISFFLAFLLISKKDKSLPDKILAVWLLVIGVHLSEFYLFITGNIYDHPEILGTNFPFPLLHGPFLFLYVASLTGRITNLKPVNLIHFLPALVCTLYLLSFFTLSNESKIDIFKSRGAGYETFQKILSISIILSGVGYVVWSVLFLKKHERTILNQFSSTEKINLHWLLYLTYGIAIIWFFVILSKDNFVFGSAVLFVIFIGYFGIKQVGIFSQKNPPSDKTSYDFEELHDVYNISDSDSPTVTESKKKYSKSGLSEEAAVDLHKRLTELMENEKLHRESELTLGDLAARLNTIPNHLSQIINDREGKNFFDYINTLRITEFKEAIENPDNRKYTLLGLAFECGFNSKSSFNRYFKKVTGSSPSEYLKQADTAL